MLSQQFLTEIDLKREKIESPDRYPFSLNAVRIFAALNSIRL
jgi:predicted ATPase